VSVQSKKLEKDSHGLYATTLQNFCHTKIFKKKIPLLLWYERLKVQDI